MQIEKMPMARIFFSKTGRAKYTSHLDTMRMFSRAFSRSGLPVWYTQGFNPHLYMTFALPIALGYESLCESLDVRLTKEIPFEAVAENLNKALPPGFAAIRAAAPAQDPKEIAWACYDARLIYADTDMDALAAKWDAFLKQPVIEVQKKTKKGERQVDIKPLALVLESSRQDGTMFIRLRCAAGSTLNINPTLLLKAFYIWSDVLLDGVRIVRTNVLDESMRDFS